MNYYSITLFFHIVGVLGIFAALGLEWTGIWQIRSAMTLDQVRGWMGVLKSVRKVGFVSMLAAVVSGAYLMVTGWGPVPWITVTLGSLVVVIAFAQVVTAPRMAAIGKTLATSKGSFSGAYHRLASDPLLWISIQTRVAIALGIIFLKTTKPHLGASLLVIGVAIVLGVASALPIVTRERTMEGRTN